MTSSFLWQCACIGAEIIRQHLTFQLAPILLYRRLEEKEPPEGRARGAGNLGRPEVAGPLRWATRPSASARSRPCPGSASCARPASTTGTATGVSWYLRLLDVPVPIVYGRSADEGPGVRSASGCAPEAWPCGWAPLGQLLRDEGQGPRRKGDAWTAPGRVTHDIGGRRSGEEGCGFGPGWGRGEPDAPEPARGSRGARWERPGPDAGGVTAASLAGAAPAARSSGVLGNPRPVGRRGGLRRGRRGAWGGIYGR